jgi:hypothetical protein
MNMDARQSRPVVLPGAHKNQRIVADAGRRLRSGIAVALDCSTGFAGVAVCSEDDVFDPEYGMDLATMRAMGTPEPGGSMPRIMIPARFSDDRMSWGVRWDDACVIIQWLNNQPAWSRRVARAGGFLIVIAR